MLHIQNVFGDDDATPVVARDMIRPITTDELLDENNPLPRGMAASVTAATEFIQDHIQSEKKKADGADADTLDRRIVAARSGVKVEQTAAEIDNLVVEWNRGSNRGLDRDELRWVRARLQDRFLGYDAVEPFMRDPRVTEILIAAPQPRLVKTFNEAAGEIEEKWDNGTRVEITGLGLVSAPGVVFGSDTDVLNLASQTLLPKNPPTVASPVQSGMLDNGTRVEVKHRIVTNGRDTFISLRRHPLSAWTLWDLIQNGSLTEELACDLATWKRDRYNAVISGPTSSGKTSLANGMLGFVDPDHHLIIVEDTPELNPPPFVFASRCRTRPAKGEIDDITINTMMRSALRSRPEILAIGEARGGELVEVLKAQRTGHHGSFTTLHADSPADTVVRMEDMLTETGEVGEGSVAHKIASAIDIIVYQKRLDNGARRVTGVVEVVKPDPESTEKVERVEIRPLYRYDYDADQIVKVADVSNRLKNIRHVPLDRQPVTMDEIRRIHEMSR